MKILILSPHTDDAELKAGGTILKMLEQKHEIVWLTFSYCQEKQLETEFRKIMNHLDIQHFALMDYPVREFQLYRQEILDILIQYRDQQFNLIIGPSLMDYHQDHIVIAKEMFRAFKNTTSILGYNTNRNSLTQDNRCIVSLTPVHILKKWEILKMYQSQINKQRNYFNRDYIYGSAAVYGNMIDQPFAEAFEILRWRM